jgi:hypothetical protein
MNRIPIILCNTLLAMVLAEGAARIAEWLHPESAEIRFAYAPYRMLRMVKAPWALNRDGFRAKEPEAYRDKFLIEFLGGSACLGVGTNTGRIIPDRLQDALHSAGFRAASVLNLCQGGATSAQELVIFLQYGYPLSPQVVLSFDGANDLMHPYPTGEDDAPNLPYRDREMRAQFDHSFLPHLALTRVAARIARRGADPSARFDLAVEPVKIYRSYIDALDAVRLLTVAHGGVYAVLLQPSLHHEKPWSVQETEMWRERRPMDGAQVSSYVRELYGGAVSTLRQWSMDTGTPFYDLSRVFARTPETVYSDSVHFTGELGYELLERELVRQGLVERISEQYSVWEQRRRSISERSALWRR